MYNNIKCCFWNAEMMVKAYMTSYKLPCIITRGNNVYGPHQFPEKLVPKFTLLAKRGEQLPVHGGGQVCQSSTPSMCIPVIHANRKRLRAEKLEILRCLRGRTIWEEICNPSDYWT